MDWAAIGGAIAGIFAGIAGYFSYQQRKKEGKVEEAEEIADETKEDMIELKTTVGFINQRLDKIDNKLEKLTDYLIDDSTGRRTNTAKRRRSTTSIQK